MAARSDGIAATAVRSAESSVRAADERRDREERGGVRLGGGDRELRARGQVDRPFGGRGQRRRRVVGQRDRRGALAPRRVDDGEDVGRGARLADAEDQAVGETRVAAVDRHDRRRRETGRQPVPDAEHVLGVDRGMVARAAGGDDDVVDVPRADRAGEMVDRLGLAREEPRGRVGLLEDLPAERHRVRLMAAW